MNMYIGAKFYYITVHIFSILKQQFISQVCSNHPVGIQVQGYVHADGIKLYHTYICECD
jgi:hypothetical protein